MYINSVFMMYMKKDVHKLFTQELSWRAGTLIYTDRRPREVYAGKQWRSMHLYEISCIMNGPLCEKT